MKSRRRVNSTVGLLLIMSRRFWFPVLLSIPITVATVAVAFFVVWLDPGPVPNEGNRWGFAILFPYTLLIQFLGRFEAGNTDFSFITPVLLQFPIYGLVLALANVKAKLRRTITALLLLHLLTLTILLMTAYWCRKTHPPQANFIRAQPNKSLDASGGSVFCIMTGPAMLD
jgi:hypothetical protein